MTPTNLLGKTEARPVLRLTRRFDAPREAVFRAWTDAAALATWFGPEGVKTRQVVSDPRPGGRFSLEMYESDGVYPVSGAYREVMPPERLVLSWIWGNGELEGLETLVTVELREKDGGTELTLIHEGLPTDVARGKHEGGWVSSFDCLERFLADGWAR
jgi:uncharacterized protein YndB with AHSA1/START domain